jgi:hypothetical protein
MDEMEEMVEVAALNEYFGCALTTPLCASSARTSRRSPCSLAVKK